MSEVETRSPQPSETTRWGEMNLMEKLVAINDLLPHDVTSLIPRNLKLDDFAAGIKAAEGIEHKGALWWGQIYKVGVEVYGQDFYQALDGFQYQKSTLQNYARLTTQIHPSLWGEEIPDRHFMAIGQNVDDPDEQREWVNYVKTRPTPISGDDLRREIHQKLVENGRRRPQTTTWRECEHCNGEGGWPEPVE